MRPRVLVLLASCCLLLFQSAARSEEEKIKSVTYPVADLLAATSELNIALGEGAAKAEKKDNTKDLDNLVNLITSTIHPESWSDVGGRGKIQCFPIGSALVVEHTPAIQEEIVDLLAALRRLTELEVALEVRLVTVPQSQFERLSLNLIPCEQTGGLAFLSARAAAQMLETAQTDCRTNVLQAPRVTGFNGQKLKMDLTETQFFCTDMTINSETRVPCQKPVKLGFEMSSQPMVSADRRFVRLALNMSLTDLASSMIPLIPVQIPISTVGGTGETKVFQAFLQKPQFNVQKCETNVSIPDGGTLVVCSMPRMVETKTVIETPVLSKIPYLGRCFSNVGYGRESQRLLVMVTPRIIVSEEKEEIYLAPMPPIPREVAEFKKMPQSPAAMAPAIQQAKWECEPVAVPPPAPGAVPACLPVTKCQASLVSDLLKAYDDACSAGRSEDAERLGRAALVLDPTCFQKRR